MRRRLSALGRTILSAALALSLVAVSPGLYAYRAAAAMTSAASAAGQGAGTGAGAAGASIRGVDSLSMGTLRVQPAVGIGGALPSLRDGSIDLQPATMTAPRDAAAAGPAARRGVAAPAASTVLSGRMSAPSGGPAPVLPAKSSASPLSPKAGTLRPAAGASVSTPRSESNENPGGVWGLLKNVGARFAAVSAGGGRIGASALSGRLFDGGRLIPGRTPHGEVEGAPSDRSPGLVSPNRGGAAGSGKIIPYESGPEDSPGKFWIHLPASVMNSQWQSLAERHGLPAGYVVNRDVGYVTLQVNAADAAEAARLAGELSADELVQRVELHPDAVAQVPSSDDVMGKVTRNGAISDLSEVWINFGTPTDLPTPGQKGAFVRRHGVSDYHYEWINGYRLKVYARTAEKAQDLIEAVAIEDRVTSISAHNDLYDGMLGTYRANVSEALDGVGPEVLWVYFREGMSRQEIDAVLGSYVPSSYHTAGVEPYVEFSFGASDGVTASDRAFQRARSLMRDPSVVEVRVHGSIAGRLRGESEPPETSPVASEEFDSETVREAAVEGPLSKLNSAGFEYFGNTEIAIQFGAGVTLQQVHGLLQAAGISQDNARLMNALNASIRISVLTSDAQETAAIAFALMNEDAVDRIDLGVNPENIVRTALMGAVAQRRGRGAGVPVRTRGKFSTADRGSLHEYYVLVRLRSELDGGLAHEMLDRGLQGMVAWRFEDDEDGEDSGRLLGVTLNSAHRQEGIARQLGAFAEQPDVEEIRVAASIFDLIGEAGGGSSAVASSEESVLSKITGRPDHYFDIRGGSPSGREVKVFLRSRSGGPSLRDLVTGLGIDFASKKHDPDAEPGELVEVRIDGASSTEEGEFVRQIIAAAGMDGVERIVISPELLVKAYALEFEQTPPLPSAGPLLDKLHTHSVAGEGSAHLVKAHIRRVEGAAAPEELASVRALTGEVVNAVSIAGDTEDGKAVAVIQAGALLSDAEFSRKLAVLAADERVTRIEVHEDKRDAVRPVLQAAEFASSVGTPETAPAPAGPRNEVLDGVVGEPDTFPGILAEFEDSTFPEEAIEIFQRYRFRYERRQVDGRYRFAFENASVKEAGKILAVLALETDAVAVRAPNGTIESVRRLMDRGWRYTPVTAEEASEARERVVGGMDNVDFSKIDVWDEDEFPHAGWFRVRFRDGLLEDDVREVIDDHNLLGYAEFRHLRTFPTEFDVSEEERLTEPHLQGEFIVSGGEKAAELAAQLSADDRVVGIDLHQDAGIHISGEFVQRHTGTSPSAGTPGGFRASDSPDLETRVFWITFRDGVTPVELREMLEGAGLEAPEERRMIATISKTMVLAPNEDAAIRAMRRLMASQGDRIENITVHPDVLTRLSRGDTGAAAPASNIRPGDLAPDVMRVYFREGISRATIEGILRLHGFGPINTGRSPVDVRPGEPEKILSLAAQVEVNWIEVPESVYASLGAETEVRAPQSSARASRLAALAGGSWRIEKLEADADAGRFKLKVRLPESLGLADFREMVLRHFREDDVEDWNLTSRDGASVGELEYDSEIDTERFVAGVLGLTSETDVQAVQLHNNARLFITGAAMAARDAEAAGENGPVLRERFHPWNEPFIRMTANSEEDKEAVRTRLEAAGLSRRSHDPFGSDFDVPETSVLLTAARVEGLHYFHIPRDLLDQLESMGVLDEPLTPAAAGPAPATAKVRGAAPQRDGTFKSNTGHAVLREGAGEADIMAMVRRIQELFTGRLSWKREKSGDVTTIQFEAHEIADGLDFAQRAIALAADERVTEVVVHPAVRAVVGDSPEALAGETVDTIEQGPADKLRVDEALADRKDVRIEFERAVPEEAVKSFIKDHVTYNGMRYRRIDNGVYVVHARDNASAARIVGAARADENLRAVYVNAHTQEDLGMLKPEVFESEAPKDVPEAVDEDRGVLVRFKADGEAEAKAFADKYGLRLMESHYRGSEGLFLFEIAETYDPDWALDALKVNVKGRGSKVASLKPLREREKKATVEPVVEEAPPEAVRRDAHSEWDAFLGERKLQDGKSTLSPEQVKLLKAFLKPVQPPPGETKHPTIGRTKEIKKILPVLTSPRGMRNSVVITGEPGTGKTAIAEGLAQLIEDAEYAQAARVRSADGSTSYLDLKRLRGRWLVELDVDLLLTSDDPVGALLSIMQILPLLNDASPSRGNEVIVLVDEIQKLMMDQKGQKIANAIKGLLRDGKLSVLATTTSKEYKEHIEGDGALARRFLRVRIDEPSVDETIEMMRGAQPYYESQHDADITEEVIEAAARLSDQFDKEHFLPDKAIKLLEDAAELARPDNLRAALALDIREGWRQLVSAVNAARQALMDKEIASTVALPGEMYNRIAKLVEAVTAAYQAIGEVQDGKGQVDVDLIKRTLADHTGISAGQLTLGEEDSSRYVSMEEEMARRVINQDRALEALANAIRRNKAGLSNPNRPMGKFLFAGPTGVGKTYIAKELARFLFNDPEAYVRFDMSEFMEEHTYMRLVGAPPSYVGYGQGGQLTEAVRKKPYSVVLFDEIEKAHPKVWDIFLQILDEGHLTDSEGRKVDFKNTVIVFTSNVGMGVVDAEKFAQRIQERRAELEGADEKRRAEIFQEIAEAEAQWDEEIALAVKEGVRRSFRPELVNRLDEDPRSKSKWIVFNRLNEDNIRVIAKIQLKEFQGLLKARHDTDLEFGDDVVEALTVHGYSPLYGARPVQGAIEKLIIDPLAKWILQEAENGESDVRGGRIRAFVEDGEVRFEALEKGEEVVERRSLAGLAEQLTLEVMDMIEDLVADFQSEEPTGEVPEPSEKLFDGLLRTLRGAIGEKAPVSAPAPAARVVFAAGRSLDLGAGAKGGAGEHNNPRKKDKALRSLIRETVAKAREAGWEAEALGVLQPEAGTPGEGWIKHFVRHAKEQADKAGVSSPVSLMYEAGEDAVRVVVRSGHAMDEAEKRFLELHFTGTPPASLKAAQRKTDDLNMTNPIVRDHNLLDLYRRVSDLPGASVGYKAGEDGTEYWLEIKKQTPQASVSPRGGDTDQAPRTEAPHRGGGTGMSPRQLRERARAKELVFKVLTSKSDDGPAIKIAAASAWAMLSTPEDLPVVRGWIMENGWAGKGWGSMRSDWPQVMAMALALERHGTAADVSPLMTIVTGFAGNSGDLYTPAKEALMKSLAAVLSRAGREAALAAYAGSGRVKTAGLKALGKVGSAEDIAKAAGTSTSLPDADAFVGLMEREAPEKLAEFFAQHWPLDEAGKIPKDAQSWNTRTDEQRFATLKLVARGTDDPERDMAILKRLVNLQHGTDRNVTFAAAEALAEVRARLDKTENLRRELETFVERHTMRSNDSKWGVLASLLYTAQKAGGAELLPALEEILNRTPGNINYYYEQAYFETPMVWAEVLVRSGKFAEYSRPRRADDGKVLPSKLQEMLTSHRPMLAAAALHAIALARSGVN